MPKKKKLISKKKICSELTLNTEIEVDGNMESTPTDQIELKEDG